MKWTNEMNEMGGLTSEAFEKIAENLNCGKIAERLISVICTDTHIP